MQSEQGASEPTRGGLSMRKGLCLPLSFLTLCGLMWLNGAYSGVRFQKLLLPPQPPEAVVITALCGLPD